MYERLLDKTIVPSYSDMVQYREEQDIIKIMET